MLELEILDDRELDTPARLEEKLLDRFEMLDETLPDKELRLEEKLPETNVMRSSRSLSPFEDVTARE